MHGLFSATDDRPVHFVGIGGAGMGALALLAHRRGIRVSGCDSEPRGAADLAALGIEVAAGHAPAHVAGARALVVSAAIRADDPELVAAREAGIPLVPRKVALGELVNGRTVVAIAGTHGKTTTTAMTTAALAAAGLDPTGLVGGRVAEWGGNARVGGDDLFVVEADEYDQAFLALQPTIAVVTNVEADHLECYGSVAALEAAFATFAGRARHVFAGADDAGARRVGAATGATTVGLAADAGVRIEVQAASPAGTTATVHLRSGPRTLHLAVPGTHNVRNAAMALAAAEALGADLDAVLGALAAFGGVGRRFERLGEVGGVALVDDYAHHPTEVVATLAAARQAFPGRRLVAVFQPHLYSRTAEHGAALGAALGGADVAVVTEIYGAREAPIPGVSGRQVADAAARTGVATEFEPARDAVPARVQALLRPGDVLLTLGAGDITHVGRELAAWLARR